jgi:hypothetical protein
VRWGRQTIVNEITKEEAIAKARAIALEKGWTWREPVLVKRERAFMIFGRANWRLMSSADRRGGNVNVRIDCKTGAVLSTGFARR